ncbi:MAG: trypsin-like peptidase domain-containing protein [Oscillospiraceae bacterium]|nr:trypsin-like peptidase domain-containing protein [Oscillospiraceae bacterium]
MENNDFQTENFQEKDNNTNRKKPNGSKVFVALIVAILLIAAIATAVVLVRDKDGKGGTGQTTSSSENAGASLNISDSKEYGSSNADGTLSTVQIAEKVKPSVIAVVLYRNNTVAGEGSGVVMGVDKSGKNTYIITCAHIVDTAGVSVKVQLEDEAEYDATVVGYDTRTDVAVIRVEATGFTAAEFGDSNALQVGEPVYAIGNPGGTAFYGSFTGGYVSAIDRPTSTSGSGYTMECIQHDAAINPGNSGGALVNSFGQVIGINSSKIASEEYEGMGFAIPISVVKEVVDDLIEKGYVEDRAKLGISYVAASSNQTYSYVLKVNDLPLGSIVVAEIDDDSNLAKTDLKAGDLIIAIDGEDLKKTDSLIKIIEKGKIGDEHSFTIARVRKDYSVEKFEVKAKLIEDKGNSSVTNNNDNSEGFSNPFAE